MFVDYYECVSCSKYSDLIRVVEIVTFLNCFKTNPAGSLHVCNFTFDLLLAISFVFDINITLCIKLCRM